MNRGLGQQEVCAQIDTNPRCKKKEIEERSRSFPAVSFRSFCLRIEPKKIDREGYRQAIKRGEVEGGKGGLFLFLQVQAVVATRHAFWATICYSPKMILHQLTIFYS